MNDKGLMPNHQNEIRKVSGVIIFLARSVAAPTELFLHRLDSFGERYFGLQSTAAAVLIFFWPVLCDPRHDPEPMFGFLYTYLFLHLCGRARTIKRARLGGPQPHSRYNGTPRVMWILRRMDEVKVKSGVEPLIAWFGGACLMEVSPPLGGFVMVSGIGLMVANGVVDRYERRRALDLHDAHVEQQILVDRFRNMRGQ